MTLLVPEHTRSQSSSSSKQKKLRFQLLVCPHTITEGSVGPFKHSVQNKQPRELVNEIRSMVDWPLNLEEAKKLRKELMNERKYLVKNPSVDVFERPFYLFEH
ncbi:hypothetical protein BGZ91_004677 [Linnemannia elongata]|nr:hypothetical protein BGZ91_004677 [Linnemannia elongata]